MLELRESKLLNIKPERFPVRTFLKCPPPHHQASHHQAETQGNITRSA